MTARFSRRSLRQLDEIADYISAESPRVAAEFLTRVDQLTSLLGAMRATGVAGQSRRIKSDEPTAARRLSV